jgi:site-specific DNA recombinase
VDATARPAADGVWLGGIVPYGYRVEGVDKAARLVPSDAPIPGHPDLTEAEVVRLIYRLSAYEQRSGLYIADHLNRLGVQ